VTPPFGEVRLAKTRVSHFVQVAGKVWGAGAGPAPSGYGVERINGSADLVISAAIMAGFLPAAPTEAIREEINQQLDWLYTNNVCAYPVIQGGVTRKVKIVQ